MELLQRTLPNIAGELVSPKMFMECLRMTQSIAIELKAQEKVCVCGGGGGGGGGGGDVVATADELWVIH